MYRVPYALTVALLATIGAHPGEITTSRHARSDTDPPALAAFGFDPDSVDVATVPASVTCLMTVTDAATGVRAASCAFRSPGGSQSASCSAEAPSQGAAQDGVWSCSLAVPQGAESGIWVVDTLEIVDGAGNRRTYHTQDLTQLGFPVELRVTSNDDAEPPLLTAFDFEPRSVDVTTGPASVLCRVSATDAPTGAGVAEAACRFKGPGGGDAGCRASQPSSGTIHEGVWTCSVTIPRLVVGGTWLVSEVQVHDGAGNISDYPTSELELMGFPTQLQVTSSHEAQQASCSSASILRVNSRKKLAATCESPAGW